ncbi:hypothetical protein I3V78_12320 [Archangium primigenium]|nr:hypothetical protein [Archangium primigenium]
MLLQSLVPGTPFDNARVEELLIARGAKALPSGGLLWRLNHGEVEVHPLREGGQWIATEIRVPLVDRTELVREVLVEGAALSEQAQVRFFDPQLGRELTRREDEAVADQYKRTVRYASDTLGMVDAMPLPTPQEKQGFEPTTRFFVGVIAFFVVLYLLVNWMGSQLEGG